MVLSEESVVEYMEVIYQSCILSMTLIVLGDGCMIDANELECALKERDFPVNHSLFVTDEDFCRDFIYDYRPDCIVVVRGGGLNALSLSLGALQNITLEANLKCTVVVL